MPSPTPALSPGAPHPSSRVADVACDPDLLSDAELDALPFGMIQLDPRGVVLRYSSVESRLSGIAAADCVGRHFFDEVAPCTHVAEFYGRFLEGVAREALDARFRFTFAFRPPRVVDVHMFWSRVTGSVWVRVRDVGREAAGDVDMR